MAVKLGLIGHPVSHSISPVLHNAALRHCGLSGEYVLFDVLESEIPAMLARLAREEFSGINVTVPHKQVVIPHMASLTESASRCGAVNTIRFEGREPPQAQGHNTDLAGFLHALSYHSLTEHARHKVLVLGAGGAARAALHALNSLGSQHVTLAARRQEPAQALLADLQKGSDWQTAVSYCSPAEVSKQSFDLVVNCTSLGVTPQVMPDGARPVGGTRSADATPTASGESPAGACAGADASPADGEQNQLPDWALAILNKSIDKDSAVFDMVYGRSLFAQPCQRLGHQFADGLEMLLGQAALSFEYWTGAKVPIAVLRAAVAPLNENA